MEVDSIFLNYWYLEGILFQLKELWFSWVSFNILLKKVQLLLMMIILTLSEFCNCFSFLNISSTSCLF